MKPNLFPRTLLSGLQLAFFILISTQSAAVANELIHLDSGTPPPNGTWSALSSGFDDTGYEMIFDQQGHLFVCGDFITAGGDTVNHVAKWDGCSWSTLGGGTNGVLRSIAIDNKGIIYIGGNFTFAGNVAANNIAMWDGNSWSALDMGVNGTVYEIAFNPAGEMFVGGCFTYAGNVNANCIAKWNGASWSAIGIGMNNCVADIAFDAAGNIFAAGWFNSADNAPANYIAYWNGTGWKSLGTGMNGRIATLAFDSQQNLYAGGDFTIVDGQSVNYIAKWDGANWASVGFGLNNIVNDIQFDDVGRLLCTGHFTATGGGTAVSRLAVWDGNNWAAVGMGMNGPTAHLAFHPNGSLYVSGLFSTADGIPAKNIAVCTNGSSLPVPVGSFPFHQSADDISPTNIDGTTFNISSAAGHTGVSNSAFKFNGSDSWVNLGSDNRNITHDVSIALWLKTEVATAQWVAGKYSFSEDHGYQLITGNGTNAPAGKIAFGVRDGTGNYYSSGFSTTSINDNNWHCIVATAGNNACNIYVDGTLENSTGHPILINLTTSNNEPFSVGWHTNPNFPGWFDGVMDDLRIFNRALTACEVEDVCSTALSAQFESRPPISFELAPNPANEYIHIRLGKPFFGEIVLLDILGRPMTIPSVETGDSEMYLDLSSVSPGMYYILLQDKKGYTGIRTIVKM